MAFLPTVSLFLLAAAATDEVPADALATDEVPADALDTEVEEGVVEEEEEVFEEEESQGEFATCMAGTQYEQMLIADGDGLATSDTCEESFTAEDCLTFPADGKLCCAYKCNSEHICSGASFVDVSDEAAGADAADSKLTECLEGNYNPSMFAFWRWTATWKRAKYNTCNKVRAAGFAPEDNAEVALCCLPGSGEAAEDEAEVEGEAEDEGEDESEARRLQEDDAKADADAEDEADADADAEAEDEAEAEAEDEAEAEAEAAAAYYPKYGAELRNAMCDGADQNPSTTTKNPDGGSPTGTITDETTSSASTFGFTALALMLVTA